QLRDADLQLNPFEQATLPHLHGRVLDYGCGLGNLARAAARQGCTVLALDASPTAIRHLREASLAEALPIEAVEADLRTHRLQESFDAVVSIGLLMFFDCPTAFAQLAQLQSHVKPGGVAAINVLVEGTTYLDMFDPAGHCLFAHDELPRRFAGWEILRLDRQDFAAPGARAKSFVTLIARKPQHAGDMSAARP
ncbi:MAG TPA: methyltransferase domain-containing protein, partial [Burkholderiaceae bacterium]|nr:methyltransferase domain-containing protein [Burkholderiaceae bacterium]